MNETGIKQISEFGVTVIRHGHKPILAWNGKLVPTICGTPTPPTYSMNQEDNLVILVSVQGAGHGCSLCLDFSFYHFRWYLDNGELAAAPPYNVTEGYTALEGFPSASGMTLMNCRCKIGKV